MRLAGAEGSAEEDLPTAAAEALAAELAAAVLAGPQEKDEEAVAAPSPEVSLPLSLPAQASSPKHECNRLRTTKRASLGQDTRNFGGEGQAGAGAAQEVQLPAACNAFWAFAGHPCAARMLRGKGNDHTLLHTVRGAGAPPAEAGAQLGAAAGLLRGAWPAAGREPPRAPGRRRRLDPLPGGGLHARLPPRPRALPASLSHKFLLRMAALQSRWCWVPGWLPGLVPAKAVTTSYSVWLSHYVSCFGA
jgi:hypothetical protein